MKARIGRRAQICLWDVFHQECWREWHHRLQFDILLFLWSHTTRGSESRLIPAVTLLVPIHYIIVWFFLEGLPVSTKQEKIAGSFAATANFSSLFPSPVSLLWHLVALILLFFLYSIGILCILCFVWGFLSFCLFSAAGLDGTGVSRVTKGIVDFAVSQRQRCLSAIMDMWRFQTIFVPGVKCDFSAAVKLMQM